MRISEIIGHEREINALRASLKSNRFAHAYLFAGPDGIGKGMLARALAAFLNCKAGVDDSCGVCPSCVAISSMAAHQNVIEIWPTDADGETDLNGLIRVAAIRDVQSRLRYKVESGVKVVIVEAADRFMPQSANAFLKTLEEPPEATVIFLITARPFVLLPTVLSRCQRVNFAPLEIEKVSAFLTDKKSYPSSERKAARMSEGSISKALAWLYEGQGLLRLQLAERLGQLTGQDADQALRFADELSKREDVDEALETFKLWYRDMAVCCSKGGAPHETLRAIACYSAINAAQEEIRPPRYANKLLAMETLVLQLAGC